VVSVQVMEPVWRGVIGSGPGAERGRADPPGTPETAAKPETAAAHEAPARSARHPAVLLSHAALACGCSPLPFPASPPDRGPGLCRRAALRGPVPVGRPITPGRGRPPATGQHASAQRAIRGGRLDQLDPAAELGPIASTRPERPAPSTTPRRSPRPARPRAGGRRPVLPGASASSAPWPSTAPTAGSSPRAPRSARCAARPGPADRQPVTADRPARLYPLEVPVTARLELVRPYSLTHLCIYLKRLAHIGIWAHVHLRICVCCELHK